MTEIPVMGHRKTLKDQASSFAPVHDFEYCAGNRNRIDINTMLNLLKGGDVG